MNEFETDTHLEHAERTSVLANERTYAAWVRTGLTSLGVGFAIHQFMAHGNIEQISLAIALVLVAFSALCFLLGAWRYHHVAVRMRSTRVTGAPQGMLALVSLFLVLASLLAIVAFMTKSS